MNTFYINTADITEVVSKLNASDKVYLSGIVYTARDAAHKRIIEHIKNGQPLPFPINKASIY